MRILANVYDRMQLDRFDAWMFLVTSGRYQYVTSDDASIDQTIRESEVTDEHAGIVTMHATHLRHINEYMAPEMIRLVESYAYDVQVPDGRRVRGAMDGMRVLEHVGLLTFISAPVML